MKVTKEHLRSLLFEEAGQDVIEYALLAALVALAAFAAMHNFGKKLGKDYTRIGKKL
ncbi:MAG TPA: Flp family type IVb pilin [Acidobacteriaceae bacterium]|jgi:Flp pilus assembly pilin Flp|nr:Flp family type IVb pilin [Acidobacteriaceae bacterium]